MSKEASCRCLISILEAIEHKNIPQSIWLKGLPYTIDHLQNKYERVEWTVFCQVIKNVRSFFTEDEFIDMGRSWANNNIIRTTMLIPRFLFERGELLHLAQRHIEKSGSQYFTCINYNTTSLGPNGIRQMLTVDTKYELFFVILGRAVTSINMKWIEKGAEYEIICKAGGGILSKIKKFFAEPFAARKIARELEEVNVTLLNRYKDLEKAQLVLQQQTTQLRTAFKINHAIRKSRMGMPTYNRNGLNN